MTMDLETVIRRRQDEIRGRPRNWRDDLGDWWRRVDLGDVLFRIWFFASMLILIPCLLVSVYMLVRVLS